MASGVLRLQLPIEFTGLGHVNCYALLDDRGAAVVDTGLPDRATWDALCQRLGQAGLAVTDVHTVIVTHSHPDHFGSAERLAKKAGAELVAEDSFHTFLEPERDESPYPSSFGRGLTPWGTPLTWGGRRQRVMRALGSHGLHPYLRPPRPTRRLRDGEEVELAGRSWGALHTPGHTGDHLCLYDEGNDVLLAGDHVLPTITPHIGGLTSLPDPLGSYCASLAGLLELGPATTVLPAHGHPFADLPGRIGAILTHHDERLATLRRASAELGTATVPELARLLFAERVWGMMAESETYAHLEFLRLRGEAERFEEDGQLCYRVDSGGGSSARQVALGA